MLRLARKTSAAAAAVTPPCARRHTRINQTRGNLRLAGGRLTSRQDDCPLMYKRTNEREQSEIYEWEDGQIWSDHESQRWGGRSTNGPGPEERCSGGAETQDHFHPLQCDNLINEMRTINILLTLQFLSGPGGPQKYFDLLQFIINLMVQFWGLDMLNDAQIHLHQHICSLLHSFGL